jgi:hypothetical protein
VDLSSLNSQKYAAHDCKTNNQKTRDYSQDCRCFHDKFHLVLQFRVNKLFSLRLVYSLTLGMAFHLFVKSWLSRVFTKGVNVIKKKSDEIIVLPLTNYSPRGHKLAESQPRFALAVATHSLPRFRRRKCMSSHLLLRTDTNGRPDNQFSAAQYSHGSRLLH